MGMSRQTLLSLWLALTLGVATWGWCSLHPDDCARYERGDRSLPATQEVVSGRGSVTVPCNVWLPRQKPPVQAAVALDATFAMVFCLSLWGDARRAAEARRDMQRR